MILVDTQSSSFLHSSDWTDDEPCLSLGIAIWFFPCSFLYTLNAGMSNTVFEQICTHISRELCDIKTQRAETNKSKSPIHRENFWTSYS